MSDASIAEYRFKAEECRLQAELSIRSEDKAQWLRLASDWQTLAENVERAERGERLIPFPHLRKVL